MEHIKNLIEAIASGDLVTSKKILESVLADKVTQRIEERKQEIAESLFIEEETVELDEEILESYLQSEEFEQLDELSKDTLKSYIRKSATSTKGAVRHAFDSGRLSTSDYEKSGKSFDKANKRANGIVKAVGKLTEEFKVGDKVKHINEGQLDELSKGTLGSYIKKASVDVGAKDAEAKRFAGLYRDHWRLDARFKADSLSAKSKSRKDSMGKAVSRLTREEFEQLDELSGGTLGSFIQKRHEKNKEVRQHTNDLENHPKITPLQSKLSDYYGRREYTKTGDSKYRKQINALHQKIHDTKKKIDPNFPKSTIQKHRGIEKAVTRLTNNKKLTESHIQQLYESPTEHKDHDDWRNYHEKKGHTIVSSGYGQYAEHKAYDKNKKCVGYSNRSSGDHLSDSKGIKND